MVHGMTAVLGLLAAVCVAVTFAQSAGQTTNRVPGLQKGPGAQCQQHMNNSLATVCGVLRGESDETDIKPESYCKELICTIFDPHSGMKLIGHKFGTALDGTWCGHEKVCVSGSCVDFRLGIAIRDFSGRFYCELSAESISLDGSIGKDA